MNKLLFEAPAEAVEASVSGRRVPEPTTAADRMVYDYESVRLFSHWLAAPLAVEDYVVQTMENVSPTKWHLAHTSWFFERFVLHEFVDGYEPVNELYYYLFNSYYNGAGPQHCRPRRGLISRPTVEQVYAYRRTIDERMTELILAADEAQREAMRFRIVLGLNHEQQHQELLLTDLKHVYSSNPLLPVYGNCAMAEPASSQGRLGEPGRMSFEEGVYEIGRALEDEGFCYDNETPRHKVYMHPFAIATRPVSNGEVLGFIEDGGYRRHELWLSEGFGMVQEQGWQMPIYWYRDGGRWMQYTLAGPREVDEREPASHLSLYEADAVVRWLGGRLPTEAEWEVACGAQPVTGNFVEQGRFHPEPMGEPESAGGIRRCFGDVWEWTGSQYRPYPGYRALEGTLGEYNGKFMCNQFVLRGGSCATSASHVRGTYRNFFAPDARWQFTGVRLAWDG